VPTEPWYRSSVTSAPPLALLAPPQPDSVAATVAATAAKAASLVLVFLMGAPTR
jgi:hypothetical protein